MNLRGGCVKEHKRFGRIQEERSASEEKRGAYKR